MGRLGENSISRGAVRQLGRLGHSPNMLPCSTKFTYQELEGFNRHIRLEW